MKKINRTFLLLGPMLIFICLSSACNNSKGQVKWPPDLPTANKNGVATLTGSDLLQVPSAVQHILDSNPEVQLTVAKMPPKIELVYFNQLPNPSFNGTGWTSWGDICVASDGKVYAGIGNHGGPEKGLVFEYCWDPSKGELKKIADLNKITGAKPNEMHFSKVHAHTIEGKDKKIYFTGTLRDGGKAGSEPYVRIWDAHIAGGKLFQYDPATGKTIVYADFPKARVTATMKYDVDRNMLYCALEGDPSYNAGFALGVFDMTKKKWIYEGTPGQIGYDADRNFMLDDKGNVYFNGMESFAHTGLRLKDRLEAWQKDKEANDGESISSASMLPGALKLIYNVAKKRIYNETNRYATLWKYDPTTNSVSPTNSCFKNPSIYFESEGFRSETRESKDGYIYGTTMAGKLFRYSPSKDEITMLGSDFLVKGEYIVVIVLSPDEKYLYYLPGDHGTSGISGTPIIQYNIETGKQKALAFLYAPMNKAFNYAPGGTFGMKMSKDGSTLYVSLNGAPSDSLRPKGLGVGFGLPSFAIIHIPTQERSGD